MLKSGFWCPKEGNASWFHFRVWAETLQGEEVNGLSLFYGQLSCLRRYLEFPRICFSNLGVGIIQFEWAEVNRRRPWRDLRVNRVLSFVEAYPMGV